MKRSAGHKFLACLLSLAMILSMQTGIVFAEETTQLPTVPEGSSSENSQECTCPTVDSGEVVHKEGCPLSQLLTKMRMLTAESTVTDEAELNTAITNAASTGATTIKLGKSFSVSTSATITDKNIILDLNGFTLSSTINTFTLNGTASLEVKDTSIGANGVVSSSGSKTIFNNGSGTVKVSSGTVSATGDKSMAIFNNESGMVNVTGGTVTATGNGSNVYAIYNVMSGTVSISGGTIGKVSSTVLNLWGNPTLSINLNNMENKQISITGELTGADGDIMLDAEYGINPALTVIATATTPEHAVAEKFKLINATGKSLVKNGANIEITQSNTTVWDGSSLTADPSYPYGGGEGTEAKPYLIANSYDLAMLAANVNAGNNYSKGKFFKLTADIDLNPGITVSSESTTAKQWIPIGVYFFGVYSKAFQGTFDGGGYTVKGVYINDTSKENQGLFGYITSATIKNVGIIGSSITAKNSVGGVVGNDIKGSLVQSCYNTGKISGNQGVGGVVGGTTVGTVEKCYNTGAISGEQRVGGIVASSTGSMIINCYNTGSITGVQILGGVVGSNSIDTSYGVVQNCYNTGDVTGTKTTVGGIVGINDNRCIVKYCYNTGAVSGGPESECDECVGGVVGQNDYVIYNSLSLGASLSTTKVYLPKGMYNTTYIRLGRVAGNMSNTGRVSACYARSDLKIFNGDNKIIPVTQNGSDGSEKDGADLTIGADLDWSTWFSGAPDDAWTYPTGKLVTGVTLPTLKNVGGTQNPTLPKGEDPPAPTVTSVTVSPKTATVTKGGTQLFTANVTGDNSPEQTVTWDVSGGKAGTSISNAGLLTVASDETAASLTVTATSTVDTSKKDTATVTVKAAAPTVTSVMVSPKTITVTKGGTQLFTANVTGNNSPEQTVTWDVSGGKAGTSISNAGLLTVASDETAVSLTVTATSTVDTSKKDTATVTVKAAAPTVWDGSSLASNPSYTYSGGNGTSWDPYQIANSYDLAMLAANVNAGNDYSNGKFFKQTADIVLNNSLECSPKVWTPIGTGESKSFKGTFDGGGHTVKGVYINNSTYYQGLFGYITSAIVKNLGVIESSIKGSYDVGGVVGLSNTSTVEQCFNTSKVSGAGFVGGVVGQSWQWLSTGVSLVQNCYNTGNVSGEANVGGVVGTSSNTTTVQNCYNIGNVTGSGLEVGGVVGQSSGGYGVGSSVISKVQNCVNLGQTVTAVPNSYVRRVVGRVNDNAPITNCYARCDLKVNGATVKDGTVNNRDGADLTVSASTEQDWGTWFSDKSAWDLTGIGKLVGGAKLPILKGFSAAQNPTLPEVTADSVAVTGVTLNKSTLTLQEGASETLNATVAPTTATNKAITWKSSNESIATVTNGTVNAIKAGSVTITVTTTDGAKSASCNVTVTPVAVRPTINITAQPQDVSVGQGKAASFTVAATMTPTGALSYQWYSNTSNSTSGGTPISGATSATYTPATATIGTAYYYCVVSGGGAQTVTSCIASLTVTPSVITIAGKVYDTNGTTPVSGAKVKLIPSAGKGEQTTSASGQYTFRDIPAGAYTIMVTYADGSIVTENVTDLPIDDVITQNFTKPAPTITITAQPQNAVALQGNSTSLTVTAKLSTNTGTLSYQWYSNTSNSTSGGTEISGPTSQAYTPATSTVGSTYYYCVVSGDGAKPVTSKVACLTVLKTSTINGTVKDKDGNPLKDAEVKLTPEAGTQNPTKTDADGKYKFNDVPDGKYTITVILPNGGGTITKELTVPDNNGSDVNIQQPVDPVIKITTQPQDVTVLQGKSTSFAVAAGASNGASVTYQWYSNTVNSTNGGTSILGATNAAYTPATATAGTTYYYCVASSVGVASVTSKIARLTVIKTSTINGTIKDKDGNPVNNADIKLTPDAGAQNPIKTGADGKYKFEDVPNGQYTIIVTLPNGGGTITKDITVPSDIGKGTDIQQPSAPIITVSSQPKNITVALNDTATFTVKAGVSSGTVVYQWYKNATNSVTGGILIIGANDASFSPSTAAKGESYYYCVLNATGATSVTSSVAKLTVRSTVTGTTVTGTVKDKDDKQVSGATVTITDKNNPGNKHTTITDTNGTYTFNNVPDGNYTITVKLPDSSTITKEITVSDGNVTGDKDVTQPKIPVISIACQPRDVSVTAGQKASFAVAADVSSGSVTYQWYSNTSNSTTGGTKIDGAEAATYTPVTATVGITYYYCVVSGSGAQAVTSNVAKLTVTAATAQTSTIEGNVTDDTTHSILTDVEVKVMKGGTDGTQFGETVKTDSNGKFEFKAIPYGSYSLVATKGDQIVTKQININAANLTENLVMLSGNKDTKVEVKGDTPSIAAQNLTEMFTPEDDKLTSESSAKVEIKLVVEKVEKPDESELAKITAIMQSNENTVVGLYLDAKLLKTITGTGQENISDEPIQPPDGQKVRIVLDLPTELQGKTNYFVVRIHDGRTLTITPVYDATMQTLAFDGDKFSTYAIAYTTSGGGNSSGGSGSSSNDAYDFWQTVKNKIETVTDGDTIKVDAKSYDKMPVSVMDSLRNNRVTLIISWDGGTITIPAGKAQKPEAARIYYPLSLLEKLYKDAKTQIVSRINPETGGEGNMWELEAPDTVENDKTPSSPFIITPPTGGFEKDAFAGTPENAAASRYSVFMFAWIVAILAAITGFLAFLRKKKNEQ